MSKKKNVKKKSLPKTLYVNRENAGTEDEFFGLHETAEEALVSGEETTVGEYGLVRVWKGKLAPRWTVED